jgi:predicted exporter
MERGLDRRLLVPLFDQDNPPDLAGLPGLLPALCDGGCRARLAAGLSPENIRRRLTDLKKSLASLEGSEALFWRVDPLNWRAEVLARLPRPPDGFRPDFLAGYPVSPDGRHLLLALRPLVSMNDVAGAKAVMADLDGLIRALPPGLDAQVVGAHRHSAANAEAIERDLALTLPLALGLLLLLYLTLVRSFGALWLFLTPAAAMLLAAAALAATRPAVSGLALGFGAAVLGIAEDYAVYIHFALRRAPDPETALRRTARPLALSALLGSAGFAVLMFSAVPAIRQLALFSALAIGAGYVWALVVLPHCPGMDRPREFSPVIALPGGGPVPRSGWIWGLFLALAAGVGLAAGRLPVDFSPRGLNLDSARIRADQEAVSRVWSVSDRDRPVFLAEGQTRAEALALAGAAAEDLAGRGGSGLASLSGLCPPPAAQAENLKAWSAFAASPGPEFKDIFLREAAALGYAPQAFEPFLGLLFAPPEPVTPERLTRLGFGFWVDYYLAAKGGRHYALLEMSAPGPPLAEKFAGRVFRLSAQDLEQALNRALAGEKTLPAAAVLVCLVILLAAFKTRAEALAAFLPSLAGLTAVLAFALLRGRPLGPAAAAALPLVIGLGADYGIVVVSEIRRQAGLEAGRAILVSCLSTMAGVGLLILARHPVLRALGETVFVGLMAALPVAVLGLPRLFGTPEARP